MTDIVKIRLRSDADEIEVQGSRADVDDLLQKWWDDLKESSNATGESHSSRRPVTKNVTQKKSSRMRKSTASVNSEKAKFDPQPTINRIRDHKDFDIWETNVLHKSNRLNKVKLVCWFVDDELTTGEIHSILHGLGDKISLPGISNTVKDNSREFRQTTARKPGARPRYSLTSKAKKEFVGWLAKDE